MTGLDMNEHRDLVPDRAGAATLSRALLQDVDTRWAHVLTAGRVAAGLRPLFSSDDARLLVAAATLHDIGYSRRVARTGFHPADGGQFLREHGYSERLVHLVAHHSHAVVSAPAYGIDDLDERFPGDEPDLLDALCYSDMHSSPTGRRIAFEDRLADIASRHDGSDFPLRAERLRGSVERIRVALEGRT